MAVVRGSAELKGLQSLIRDLGQEVSVEMRSHATAAISIVSRLGLCKDRHLAVADLWVQQAARRKYIEYHKVDGAANPADTLTKAVEQATMLKHIVRMHLVRLFGRAASAPQRTSIEITQQIAVERMEADDEPARFISDETRIGENGEMIDDHECSGHAGYRAWCAD